MTSCGATSSDKIGINQGYFTGIDESCGSFNVKEANLKNKNRRSESAELVSMLLMKSSRAS